MFLCEIENIHLTYSGISFYFTNGVRYKPIEGGNEMEEVIQIKKRKLWLYFLLTPVIILLIAFFVYSFMTKSFFFKEKPRPTDTGYTYSIEEMVINLKDSHHYLKTKLVLGYGMERDIKLIQGKEVQLRDNIIAILRSKSREDILPVENTEKLKVEILTQLNQHFEEDVITDIYITEFLVQ